MCWPDTVSITWYVGLTWTGRQQGGAGSLTKAETPFSRWTKKSREESHCSLDPLKMSPSHSLVNTSTYLEGR